MPSKKVGAGALAGAISVLLVWVIKNFTGTDIPGEQASGITTIITFITSYFVTDAT